MVKWQFLLKWCKNAGYSKVSAKTTRAPATRGLQSQAALVSAQRIESCEQNPSSGRRALHGACFWGLKNKHFWLRGCGPSLYMYIYIYYIYIYTYNGDNHGQSYSIWKQNCLTTDSQTLEKSHSLLRCTCPSGLRPFSWCWHTCLVLWGLMLRLGCKSWMQSCKPVIKPVRLAACAIQSHCIELSAANNSAWDEKTPRSTPCRRSDSLSPIRRLQRVKSAEMHFEAGCCSGPGFSDQYIAARQWRSIQFVGRHFLVTWLALRQSTRGEPCNRPGTFIRPRRWQTITHTHTLENWNSADGPNASNYQKLSKSKTFPAASVSVHDLHNFLVSPQQRSK